MLILIRRLRIRCVPFLFSFYGYEGADAGFGDVGEGEDGFGVRV
jgi:hypothetical protein